MVLIAGDFIHHPANRAGADDGSGTQSAPPGPEVTMFTLHEAGDGQ